MSAEYYKEIRASYMNQLSDTPKCHGCGEVISIVDQREGYSVCLDCTKARQAAVMAHGACKCAAKRNPDARIRIVGSRKWIACNRCLGTVRQLA